MSIDRFKSQLHDILELDSSDGRPARAFAVFIMTLIALNVLAVILATEKTIELKFGQLLSLFELFSVIVFSIEYALRVWSCTAEARYAHPIFGRIRYATSPMALIDLMAFLPFYLPLLIPFDMRFLRALRLFRLIRVFKIGRYSDSIKSVFTVLSSKKEELVVTVSIMVLLLVLASSLMYFVEHDAQPDDFSSIPAAMWWGANTLTTVGYGDIYPKTALGKVLGAMISILGIGMFALPAGVLASGFAEEFAKRKKKKICKHCGKELE